MQIGDIVKLDQHNRLHIPNTLMKEAGIEPNSEVVITYEVGSGFLKITPKAVFDDVKNTAKAMQEWSNIMKERIEKLRQDLYNLTTGEEDNEEEDEDKIKVVGVQDDTI